jgi:hypothetical protein
MYRENVAPPVVVPPDAAQQAVKNCAMIQLGVVGLNVVSLLPVALRFSVYKSPGGATAADDLLHQWSTGMLLGLVGYVIVFGAWGGLNAWGLGKRSKVARWSSIGFAAATIATCCASPIGGFLLYLLLRRDVKGYFD